MLLLLLTLLTPHTDTLASALPLSSNLQTQLSLCELYLNPPSNSKPYTMDNLENVLDISAEERLLLYLNNPAIIDAALKLEENKHSILYKPELGVQLNNRIIKAITQHYLNCGLIQNYDFFVKEHDIRFYFKNETIILKPLKVEFNLQSKWTEHTSALARRLAHSLQYLYILPLESILYQFNGIYMPNSKSINMGLESAEWIITNNRTAILNHEFTHALEEYKRLSGIISNYQISFATESHRSNLPGEIYKRSMSAEEFLTFSRMPLWHLRSLNELSHKAIIRSVGLFKHMVDKLFLLEELFVPELKKIKSGKIIQSYFEEFPEHIRFSFFETTSLRAIQFDLLKGTSEYDLANQYIQLSKQHKAWNPQEFQSANSAKFDLHIYSSIHKDNDEDLELSALLKIQNQLASYGLQRFQKIIDKAHYATTALSEFRSVIEGNFDLQYKWVGSPEDYKRFKISVRRIGQTAL